MNPFTMAILITAAAIVGSYLIGRRMDERISTGVAAGLGVMAAYGWKFHLGFTDALSVRSMIVVVLGVLICGSVARLGRKAK